MMKLWIVGMDLEEAQHQKTPEGLGLDPLTPNPYPFLFYFIFNFKVGFNAKLLINKIIVYFDFAIIENSYFLVHFNVFHFVKKFYSYHYKLDATFMIFAFISNLTCLWCLLLFYFFKCLGSRHCSHLSFWVLPWCWILHNYNPPDDL